jgi:predicted phage replisome organizer
MAEYNKQRYYWIKLTDKFMTSDTVDFLMSQKDGANYVILYQMLCLKTVNNDGQLARTLGEIIVPYDEEKIQRDTKWFSIDTIRVAMNLYRKLGLIYEQENGTLRISNFENMIGSQTVSAYKKQIQIENRGGTKVEKIPPDIDIEKDKEIDIYKYIKEKECIEKDTTPFDTFISKYSINVDNYSARITEMDFNLLDKAFSESNWLCENYVSLSRICKDYEKIVGGYYKDFVKPKEEKPDHLTDAEFLILKGFSKEWVMSLSEEERAEKRKKWEN